MATATLTRQPIMLIDDSNERLQLANKAESLLGYSVLRKHLKQPGELGKGLRELGIEPFNFESVNAYKKEMRESAQRELDSKMRDMSSNRTATGIAMMERQQRGSINSIFGRGAGFQQMAYEQLIRNGLWEQETTYRAAWKATSLSEYGEPIPEYVLNKAIEIKEKCPSATFLVDSLIVEAERRTLDPFLIVRQDDETYYVEVWDEPKFEISARL